MFRIAIIVLVLTSAIPLYALQSDNCPIAEWWQAGGIHIVDFFDIANVADATARVGLAPVVIELQRSRRAFERTPHPACLDNVVEHYSNGLRGVVHRYLAFMGEDDDAVEASTEELAAEFESASDLLYELGYMLDLEAGQYCNLRLECS